MNAPRPRRLLLPAALTALVFAAVLWSLREGDRPAQAEQAGGARNDWPLYGGTVQRNLVNLRERNLPIEWDINATPPKNVKWVQELGSRSYGGPVVIGGKVFVGTNNEKPRDPAIKGDKGVIMCFEEATGNFLWQAVHDKLVAGRVNDWPLQGICSTPVIEGNRLWYVSNRAEVICADVNGDPANPGKAKFLWSYDMIKELGVFPHNLATCSSLIVGDLLFIITSNGVDEGHINIPAPKAPSFITMDKNNGKVLWTNNLPTARLLTAEGQTTGIKGLVDRGQVLMHGQWSNPVYAEPNGKPMTIFPGGEGWLYAFEPKTGKLIWKFDCNPKDSFYVLGGKGTRNDFVSTPIVVGDRLYIGVGQDPEHNEGIGHLWCIDITKEGDVSPDLTTDDSVFPPKTKPNTNSAAVWHFGGPTTPEDKKKLQRNYYFGRTLSTCAVHDGLLYTADLNGFVYCLEAKTGKVLWDHEMKTTTWSSPYWVDGKVYMGNDEDMVIVFQHGRQKKVLGEIQMDGKVRATPVACNGVLYVMTENKLYAVSAK